MRWQSVLVFLVLGPQSAISFLGPHNFLSTRSPTSFSKLRIRSSARECSLADAGGCLEQAGASGIESLSTAGKVLAKASENFIVSWDDTADELYSCADAFESAASECKSSDPKLAAFLDLAAEEMRAASEVSGCLSAAPSAAAPNLLSFSAILADAAQHVAANDSVLSESISGASQAMAHFVAAVEES